MSITREEHIELIRQVQELRDRIEAIMEVLMPTTDEGGECPHPPNCVEDESSMGEPLFRCTRCGATQHSPFTAVL